MNHTNDHQRKLTTFSKDLFDDKEEAQRFVCSSCGEIPKTPYVTKKCHVPHVYCQPCKESGRYEMAQCKDCKGKGAGWVENRKMFKSIGKLMMTCPACIWSGNCRDYEGHLKSCDQRDCPKCGAFISGKTIREHQKSSECMRLNKMVQGCPYGCDGMFNNVELKKHEENAYLHHLSLMADVVKSVLGAELPIVTNQESQPPALTEEAVKKGPVPPAFIPQAVSDFVFKRSSDGEPRMPLDRSQTGPLDLKLLDGTIVPQAVEQLRDNMRGSITEKRLMYLESIKEIIQGSLLVSSNCTTPIDDVDTTLAPVGEGDEAGADASSISVLALERSDTTAEVKSESSTELDPRTPISLSEKIRRTQDEIGLYRDVLEVLQMDETRLIQTCEDFDSYRELMMKRFKDYEVKIMQTDRLGSYKEDQLRELTNELRDVEDTSYDGIMLWCVTDVKKKLQEARSERAQYTDSPHFYNKRGGYKACIRLQLASDMDAGYAGVFLVIMKGEYDLLLKWPPPKVNVSLSILDQSQAAEHQRCLLSAPNLADDPFKQPRMAKNLPFGNEKLLPMRELVDYGTSRRTFMKEDKMFIKAVMDMGGKS